MIRRNFSIALQISSVLLFIAIAFATVLFAEGYQYDTSSRTIVKKGLIHFEGGTRDMTVLLDSSKVTDISNGELRVEPGVHGVSLTREGYFKWKKQITVPEDEVVVFPRIRLLPYRLPDSFIKKLERADSWVLHSASPLGFFLVNRDLHSGKYYSFQNLSQEKFWMREIPFQFQSLVAGPDPELLWRGIGNGAQLFLYQSEKQNFIKENWEERFLDLKAVGDVTFGLDSVGRIWDVDRQRLLLNLPNRIVQLRRVIAEQNHYLFLLSTTNHTWLQQNLLLLTDKDGKILWQKEGAESAFMRENLIHYTEGRKLFVYDIKDHKVRPEYPVDEPMIWLSRIENTFHFLFLTRDRELRYCDEDYENCYPFAKLDSPFIESSPDGLRFVSVMNGYITIFDFGEQGFFPELLENFVSGRF